MSQWNNKYYYYYYNNYRNNKYNGLRMTLYNKAVAAVTQGRLLLTKASRSE